MTMRDESELQNLRQTLAELTDFVQLYGSREEADFFENFYATITQDVIDWVLEEVSTEDFLKYRYLNIEQLRSAVHQIKYRMHLLKN